MNYIKEIVNILDVELGEKFNIQIDENVLCWHDKPQEFWFNEDGLQTKGDLRDQNYLAAVIGRLIDGSWSIVKKPWRPKCGGAYWIVLANGSISYYYNNESTQDIAFMALGNCFESKEKAEKNREKMLDKMQAILNKE